jgi:hypothetical protein
LTVSKKKIECLCGHSVTSNTWKIHVLGKKCGMSNIQKIEWLDKYDFFVKNGHSGWLKSDGIEAIQNKDCFVSILTNKTTIDDWVFVRPRPIGQVRKSTALKFSNDRKGKNNPAVKAKMPDYEIDVVKKRAKELFLLIQSTGESFRTIIKMLENDFPLLAFFMTQFIKKPSKSFRGDNQENAILSFLLDIDTKDLIEISHKIRGKFIAKGQHESPIFSEIASKIAANMFSDFRCSKPHKILFEMIKELDPLAIMEHKLKKDNKWRSFDIYSPGIGALIECHGRVWHDLDFTNNGLRQKCISNIKNDKFKEAIAVENHLEYIVFWDNETHLWAKDIKNLYGKETISYEEAKNRIYEKTEYSSSNGLDDA